MSRINRSQECHAKTAYSKMSCSNSVSAIYDSNVPKAHTHTHISTAQMHSTHSNLMKSIDFLKHTYVAQRHIIIYTTMNVFFLQIFIESRKTNESRILFFLFSYV